MIAVLLSHSQMKALCMMTLTSILTLYIESASGRVILTVDSLCGFLMSLCNCCCNCPPAHTNLIVMFATFSILGIYCDVQTEYKQRVGPVA